MPGMSSLGTLGPPPEAKGRHSSSPSTPVEPIPLGKLGWLLRPRWGFFDSQRAEGEAGLSRAAPFLEPQCHQAESFSARPAAPGCFAPSQGRPVLAGGEGRGHRGRSVPAPAPARLPGGRTPPECARRVARRARSLTCPPSSPGLPSRGWRRGLGSRHVPAQAGEATRPGPLAHDWHPCPPCRSQVGRWAPWGLGGHGEPGTRCPPSRAAVPAATETGDKGEVAGALTEAAFSRPAGEFPASLLLDPDTEEARRAGAWHPESEQPCLASFCSRRREAGSQAPRVSHAALAVPCGTGSP